MQPQDDFVCHVGRMEGLDANYLPAAFVSFLLAARVVIVVLLFATPLVALALPWLKKTPVGLACALLMAFEMLLLAIPFHQFPDEIFVTLEQSRNLAEHGRYSFDADRNTDGSGDGLFYVAIGALHAAGIPSPLGALLLGAACGAASIFLLYRHALETTSSPAWAWLISLLACILECFGRLAGSGWSASMLGLITIASILLWRSKRWPWTFALTGILPFCRYDFSFYTAATGAILVALSSRGDDRPWKRVAKYYGASLAGIVALLVAWRVYYGHFVPTCILMKAGSWARMDWTLKALHDYASELFPVLFLLALGIRFTPRENLRGLSAWIAPGLVHFALVLWGGGDYFPGNRYQVVLTGALLVAAIDVLPGVRSAALGAMKRQEFPAGMSRAAWVTIALLLVVVAGAADFHPKATDRVVDGMIPAHREPAREIWLDAQGLEAMTVSRLNNHALTGRFFARLAEKRPGTRLASLEVASCFYFYGGPCLDVQGFVDRNVATGPRNPAPRRKWDKRLDPAFWERERPEIIWLDTSTENTNTFGFPPGMSRLRGFLEWSRHWGWTEPYFASEYLLHNYRPRCTVLNGRFFILWLVRDDLAPEFDRRLAELGILPGDLPR